MDLDTENLTFLDNERVCVLLNATSSVITENVTLALELSTSDPDVTFHSDTAYITVTPAPGMPAPTEQQCKNYIIPFCILYTVLC